MRLDPRDSPATARHSQRLAERIIEVSLDGIMITNAEGVIEHINPAFTRLTGYSAEEAIGRTPALLSSGHHDADFYRRMWAQLREAGQWEGEIWNRRKNGELYPEYLSIAAIHDDEGQVTHYAALFNDITKLKESERQVRHLAYYDALTGLPNRRLLEDRLTMAVAHAHRHQLRLAVLFIDLDRFKLVNDTLGHHAGDELLREVARRLQTAVREDDTVARTGGDEFVVLLSEIEDATAAELAAQRVLDVMRPPVDLNGHPWEITCSVGIGRYPEDGDTEQDLLRHADTAMYQAKQAGRNRYRS